MVVISMCLINNFCIGKETSSQKIRENAKTAGSHLNEIADAIDILQKVGWSTPIANGIYATLTFDGPIKLFDNYLKELGIKRNLVTCWNVQ